MKTAVSIPDEVFLEADRVARQAGISRSELYARALRAYLDRIRDDLVTLRLNEIYETEPSETDAFTRAASAATLARDPWTT
jgi:hypothetical protein